MLGVYWHCLLNSLDNSSSITAHSIMYCWRNIFYSRFAKISSLGKLTVPCNPMYLVKINNLTNNTTFLLCSAVVEHRVFHKFRWLSYHFDHLQFAQYDDWYWVGEFSYQINVNPHLYLLPLIGKSWASFCCCSGSIQSIYLSLETLTSSLHFIPYSIQVQATDPTLMLLFIVN